MIRILRAHHDLSRLQSDWDWQGWCKTAGDQQSAAHRREFADRAFHFALRAYMVALTVGAVLFCVWSV